MVTITQTATGWTVRINGTLYGTYSTEEQAAANAAGMDRDWN